MKSPWRDLQNSAYKAGYKKGKAAGKAALGATTPSAVADASPGDSSSSHQPQLRHDADLTACPASAPPGDELMPKSPIPICSVCWGCYEDELWGLQNLRGKGGKGSSYRGKGYQDWCLAIGVQQSKGWQLACNDDDFRRFASHPGPKNLDYYNVWWHTLMWDKDSDEQFYHIPSDWW